MEPWDYHHQNHLDLGGRSTLLPPGRRCLCSYALVSQALQQKTTDQRRESSQLQNIQGVVENVFGILAGRFRVLLTTMEQRPKVVRHCVVLHNMLRSHQRGAERPPTPADNIQPSQNDRGSRNRRKMSEIH